MVAVLQMIADVGRWFLGALSSDSDPDDKWKVHLKDL